MSALRLACVPVYSVKTRVILELEQMPATVGELENAGCGARSSIHRVVRRMLSDGEALRLPGRRYALRNAPAYEVLP